MNTVHTNYSQDHMKIGRYQSWMEEGRLKLSYHQVGSPNGMYCTMTPEEAKGLLELLSRHSDDINQALYTNEHEHRNLNHM
jgi:hypothetical protein